jgi:hypothetical protein
MFGSKTLIRVKEFQSNNGLAADGVVGPKTWGKLESATGKQATPPVSKPPGAKASRILQEAKVQIGSVDYQRRGPNGEPHGWRHLGDILSKGANLHCTDSELKQTWQPKNKSWCGIFCVYCYQRAGIPVTWNLYGGGPQGPIRKYWPWHFPSRKEFEAAIRPGDIAVIADRAHHFIVVSTNAGSGQMETVDGNLNWGRIQRLSIRRLPQIVAFYSPA